MRDADGLCAPKQVIGLPSHFRDNVHPEADLLSQIPALAEDVFRPRCFGVAGNFCSFNEGCDSN